MQSQERLVKFTQKFISSLLYSTRLFNNSSRTENNKPSHHRIWSNLFVKNKRDGSIIKLRVQDVLPDQFEDFIDFKLKYYAMEEFTFNASGVHKNPEAVKECRKYLATILSKPTIHSHVYILDDDEGTKNNIIGASSLALVKENDYQVQAPFKVKTKEMKKMIEIWSMLNNHFSIEEMTKKYGVNQLYHDEGLAIHPNYRLLGIAHYEALMRKMVCKTNAVSVTGGWCTMPGSQRACELDGWDTLFELPYDKFASILGDDFKAPAPSCKYMAVQVK